MCHGVTVSGKSIALVQWNGSVKIRPVMDRMIEEAELPRFYPGEEKGWNRL